MHACTQSTRTCANTCMHRHARTRAYKHMHTCTHSACARTCAHKHACARKHVRTNTCVRKTHLCTQTCMCMQTHAHAHRHACAHRRTHAHKCARTHMHTVHAHVHMQNLVRTSEGWDATSVALWSLNGPCEARRGTAFCITAQEVAGQQAGPGPADQLGTVPTPPQPPGPDPPWVAGCLWGGGLDTSNSGFWGRDRVMQPGRSTMSEMAHPPVKRHRWKPAPPSLSQTTLVSCGGRWLCDCGPTSGGCSEGQRVTGVCGLVSTRLY